MYPRHHLRVRLSETNQTIAGSAAGGGLALAGIIVGFSLIGIFIVIVILLAVSGYAHLSWGFRSIRLRGEVRKGLTYGVKPEPWTPPDEGNHLLVGLSKVPMRLEERRRAASDA